MPDRITLTGLTARGNHGVFAHERRDGQAFSVDVVVELDLAMPAHSDEVSDTLNYADVARLVYEHITGEPVNLLETLAARIADAIAALSAPRVHAIEVTVHKPQAPIPHEFADVSVSVRREFP